MTVAVGTKIDLDGVEYEVIRLAGKEVRLEADGVVKYRAVRTVKAMLAKEATEDVAAEKAVAAEAKSDEATSETTEPVAEATSETTEPVAEAPQTEPVADATPAPPAPSKPRRRRKAVRAAAQ